MVDQTRRGPGGDPVLEQNIVLAGDDKAERIAIAEIIEALHEQLPRCPSRWNEKTRNQTELYAWLNGRHRICDLAGVASG